MEESKKRKLEPELDETPPNKSQTNATRKIRRSISSNLPALRQNIKKRFLQSICSVSGECIVFGVELANIKSFFHDFNFDYMDVNQIKPIGDTSANGFLREFKYSNDGYNAFAILKSSVKPSSDNLFYEALVGKFVNKLTKLYPCFVETYKYVKYRQPIQEPTLPLNQVNPALFQPNLPLNQRNPALMTASLSPNQPPIQQPNQPPNAYTKLKDSLPVTKDELTNDLLLIDIDTPSYNDLLGKELTNSVENPTNCAVLIQHLHNTNSLYNISKENLHNDIFYSIHLVNYLFQIYCPLAHLKDEFTHYDLHLGNILIYQSYRDKKYVKMNYHLKDGTTVTFNTFGIAKIIDYGRCYFNDKEANFSSKDIYYALSVETDAKMRYYSGYTWLEPEDYPGSSYYISALVRNMSHDLLPLSRLKVFLGARNNTNPNPNPNLAHLDKLVISVKYEGDFGTPEMMNHPTNKVLNVQDAFVELTKIINENYFKVENEKIFRDKEPIGEMHIWMDGSKPMEYVPFRKNNDLKIGGLRRRRRTQKNIH